VVLLEGGRGGGGTKSGVVHLPVKKPEQQTDPHGEEKKKTEIKMIVLKIN